MFLSIKNRSLKFGSSRHFLWKAISKCTVVLYRRASWWIRSKCSKLFSTNSESTSENMNQTRSITNCYCSISEGVKFNIPQSKSNPSTQSKFGLWSQLPTPYLKTEIEKKPLQYSKWRERCQLIPKKPKIEKEWKRKWNCYKRKNRQ